MGRWVTRHQLTHHRSTEGRRVEDSPTHGPPGRNMNGRGRGHFFLKMGVMMMVMTCCSKLAVLPTLHSAVMIIIAAQTELGITAAIIAAAAYAEWSHWEKSCQQSASPSQANRLWLGGFPLQAAQTACRTCVKLGLLYRVWWIYSTWQTLHVRFTWKCDANCWLYCLRASIALY